MDSFRNTLYKSLAPIVYPLFIVFTLYELAQHGWNAETQLYTIVSGAAVMVLLLDLLQHRAKKLRKKKLMLS